VRRRFESAWCLICTETRSMCYVHRARIFEIGRGERAKWEEEEEKKERKKRNLSCKIANFCILSNLAFSMQMVHATAITMLPSCFCKRSCVLRCEERERYNTEDAVYDIVNSHSLPSSNSTLLLQFIHNLRPAFPHILPTSQSTLDQILEIPNS